jgi:hypothetical protein
MHDRSAKFKIGLVFQRFETERSGTTQVLRLICGHAASGIMCEALSARLHF